MISNSLIGVNKLIKKNDYSTYHLLDLKERHDIYHVKFQMIVVVEVSDR